MSQIDEILEDFAKWTITNVEHGIYIPLPSPEIKQALKSLLLEHRLIVKDSNEATKEDWFEAIPIEAIERLFEETE